jgi:lipopolysaccharide assembly outer membrane protein LptD (OstA)
MITEVHPVRKLFLILGLAILASAQTGSTRVPPDEMTFRALHQSTDGSVIRLKGDVEIATHSVILKCDEADYNRDSHEVEARGTVKVKLITEP